MVRYTIKIPFVASIERTQWHPDAVDGPFSVLTRGNFPDEHTAVKWAQLNLNGTPYTIERFYAVPDGCCAGCGEQWPCSVYSNRKAYHSDEVIKHYRKPESK